MINESEFLEKYNHTKDVLKVNGLKWSELNHIATDYEEYRKRIDHVGKYLVERFINVSRVHSVRYRLKDTEHLLDKIIRKKIADSKRIINIENYKQEITDLMGLRILHLFKEDWQCIHEFITGHFNLADVPKAYYREGDSIGYIKRFEEQGCKVEIHKFGYRSVHYLIKSTPEKEDVISEIQVRTIFEEAWSEIDHTVRYPNITDNSVLEQFLQIFNRLAGSSDEMGSYVVNLKNHLDGINKQIEDLKSRANRGQNVSQGLDFLKQYLFEVPEPPPSQLVFDISNIDVGLDTTVQKPIIFSASEFHFNDDKDDVQRPSKRAKTKRTKD